MLGPHQADRPERARRRGDYWYYSRHRQGQAVPHLLPQEGQPRRARRSPPRRQRAGKGEKFFSARPAGRQRRRQPARLRHRHHRLPRVPPVRQGPAHRQAAGRTASAKSSDFAWAADNQTLFYVTEDAAKRPHKLWRHTLGTPKDKDALVYEEKDELFRLGVGRSRDKKYLFAIVGQFDHDRGAVPAGRPADRRLEESSCRARTATSTRVEHRDGLFYIRTNKDAKNFRLVTAPVADPSPKNWKDLVPHRPDACSESACRCSSDYVVVSEREAGLPQFAVMRLGHAARRTASASRSRSIRRYLDANPEFDTPTFRYSYTSLVTPQSVYEYDLKTRRARSC